MRSMNPWIRGLARQLQRRSEDATDPDALAELHDAQQASDIARTLDIDPNAAHQLLHRAKQALRTHLQGASP